jgi:hypothetical protein
MLAFYASAKASGNPHDELRVWNAFRSSRSPRTCNGDPMCIEQAEVAAFQCRDDARNAARPGFASCRAGFKSCVQACPPPPSPSGAFLD